VSVTNRYAPLNRNIAARESARIIVIAFNLRQETSNVIRKPALCACLLLGTATASLGQSMQEHLTKCMSADPDTRIAACTAIIQAPVANLMAGLHVGKASENLSAAYNNRGDAYYKKGDYDRAIPDFSEAIRLSPSFGYYRERGIAYIGKGDYDQAIQDFSKAIRLNPNDAFSYVYRGEAYDHKRDYDSAIQDFNEAIRLSSKNSRAYGSRGQAYREKDDYDRAIDDYSEAIRLNPKDLGAYFGRGLAYHRKGDYERAIQDFNEVIRVNPKYPYSYESRGEAYLFQSNLTAATASFKDAIAAAPSSTVAVFAVLMLHVAVKGQRHDDAQELASVAAAADLSKWPGPVLKFDLGQMTADDVLKAAANADANIQKWQICEANYFTGEDALFHHQRTTALAHLKAARDDCPKGYSAYLAVLMELKRLEVPAAPTK
jgi:tetratricopeptide (TPR) repeat protein